LRSTNSFYEILGDTSSHQLDYQFRAINGYSNISVPFLPPIGIEPGNSPVIVVSTSEWSSTHTITLPDYNPPTTTPTPTNPNNQPTASNAPNNQTNLWNPNDFMVAVTVALTIISIVLIVAVLFLIMLYKKLQRGNQIAHAPSN
jgi:hypothetical protein